MSFLRPVRSRLTYLLTAVRFAIPEGSRLPDRVWRQRHRAILVVLWLQALGIVCFALYTRRSVAHSLLEGGIIAGAGLVAAFPLRPRTLQASVAAFGLIASSAVLVHLSGGYIELHFHFFVMVGLMALYQEWVPFVLAIGFVLLHHGVVGVLYSPAVYNHPAAIAHPWQWAAIHALFIAAMSVVSLITWRVNETSHALAQLLLKSAGEGIVGLDLERRVTFVNDAAVKLLEWGHRQVLGEHIQTLLPKAGDAEAGLDSAIREPGAIPRAAQAAFRRADGTAMPVEYVSTPITERGKIVGTVLVLKDVTERQRLFQESERRRRAAEGLDEVGRLISQSLDPQEVNQRIVDSTRTLLSGFAAALYRVDPVTEDLVASAASGEVGRRFNRDLVIPAGIGAAGLAVRQRQVVVTADVLADPRIHLTPDFQSRVAEAGYRAVLAVPLVTQGRVIGALGVGDHAGRIFDAEDVRISQAFADHATIAMENAQLHREIQERLTQSETLLTVGQQVSGTLDVTEMMRLVAKEAGRALGADMVGAFLIDATHAYLRPIAGYHVPKHLLADFMAFPIPLKGHRILEEAWEQRQPVALSDVAADPRVDRELFRRFPHRSNLFCPMIVQGEPIGGFFVTWFEREHCFTPAELRLVEGISRQAGIALANARLVEELKARQARLEALLGVGHELSRIQPAEPLLARIAEAGGRLLDATSVSFRLVDGEDLMLCGTWGSTGALTKTARLKIGESLTGVVAATREPLVVQDPASDPRLIPAHREGYRELGVRAFLGVPVKTGDRVVGVLSARTTRKEGFSAADVDMAMALASQAAIALENSRLYQETQRAFDELSQTQDQLVQAQKMEAVGQLAGGIAHDFNNLLTVISGRSHLLLGRLLSDEPARRDVEIIQKTSERAAALTRQLLAFSRKQVLQPKPLDLNALVGGLAPMLRRLIGEHIELVIVPGSGRGPVMADPGQLEQVIMNLVVNARDAMPDGGMVKIETGSRDLQAVALHAQGKIPPGQYVTLMVDDTGCGIDSATLARMFEPFFTTKDPGKGTGLGLSTVHGIVHQSGGFIGVDSTVGRGTTFTIYLPRTAMPAGTPEAQASAAPLARGQETILLVEDEEEVRQLASEILKVCGYTVLDTGDPLEALVMGERHQGKMRLLLTDMVMPAMGGPALAAQLLGRHPDLRVLYMSGYPDRMVASGGAIEPAGTFLQKPFTPEALAGRVREVLDAAAPG